MTRVSNFFLVQKTTSRQLFYKESTTGKILFQMILTDDSTSIEMLYSGALFL